MHPEFPDVRPDERMEMDVDKSRGIREEIPIQDCDTLDDRWTVTFYSQR